MNCKYCNKTCKNRNSLTQHQIRCKNNPDKLTIKSNFINYNKKVKSGEVIKEYGNQYIKAKKLGLPKPKISEDTLIRFSKNASRKWTTEQKEAHSLAMLKAVSEHPESYSNKNVCGRTKPIKAIDSYGNVTNLTGGWEFIVSEYLNKKSIKWTNKITEVFEYEWDGKLRKYYPDFYLPELDKYIEVKGYERERDIAKWKCIESNRLVIIKSDEISLIKQDSYCIF